MARAIESLVTQSVLDRLSTAEDWPSTRAQSLHMLKETLRRDMEWLLNTRQPPIPGIDGYATAKRTVVQYGLIDISTLSISNGADQARLQQAVQVCLENYEPRLDQVRVRIDLGEEAKKRQLRFHIEARILLDPAPEEVFFDTLLDLTSGEYTVS